MNLIRKNENGILKYYCPFCNTEVKNIINSYNPIKHKHDFCNNEIKVPRELIKLTTEQFALAKQGIGFTMAVKSVSIPFEE